MDKIYVADPDETPLVTHKFSIKEKILELRSKVSIVQQILDQFNADDSPEKSLSQLWDSLKSGDNGEDHFRTQIDVDEMRKNSGELHKTELKPVDLPDDHLPIGAFVRAAIARQIAAEKKTKRRKIETDRKMRHRSKYTGIRWIEDGESTAAPDDQAPDLAAMHDACLSVRVYRPFRHIMGSKNPEQPKFSQEIVITSKQSLTELRAAIMCAADMGVPRDISEHPDAHVEERAWDVYKSAYFFIDNVFYNDMQTEGNVDYSAVDREWAERNGIGTLTAAKMEETRVEDLVVQLGYPYLYKHQGNCEHLLVFSDLRLLNDDDPLTTSSYPYVRTGAIQHCQYCMICGRFMAKWVVYNSPSIPVNPCYECDECFRSFHYVDGRKVGQFQAYAYIDNTSLV